MQSLSMETMSDVQSIEVALMDNLGKEGCKTQIVSLELPEKSLFLLSVQNS